MRYVTREVFLSDFRAIDELLSDLIGHGWTLIGSGAYMDPGDSLHPTPRAVMTYTFDTHNAQNSRQDVKE